jgi:acyl-CoA thioesterase-1
LAVVRRIPILVAVAISLVGCWSAAPAQARSAALPQPGVTYSVLLRPPGAASGDRPSGEPGCEQEIERGQPRGGPRLVIVGASFTAGVGPGPGRSWAVLLARHLHWDAVVYGDPGAGYVRVGAGRKGPVGAEIGRVGLRALEPSLVIVQAGHDDIGVPPGLERAQAARAIALIRAQAPRARIVLLTVFAGRARPAAADRTDQAIVRAARAADPAVIIIDPLADRWRFPHVRDGLHPTAAGSAWIATRVAEILLEHGVRPARAGGAVICDPAWPSPAARL